MLRNNKSPLKARIESANGVIPMMARAPPIRRQRSSYHSKAEFKLIIASVIVFLVIIWKYLPGTIISSRSSKASSSQVASRAWKPNLLAQAEVRRRDKILQRKQSFWDNTPSENDTFSHLPTLIIGGSDGSGTRSFADAVRSLGVNMKTDIKSNLDIQSGAIFHGEGFPPLINLILEETRSANYEVTNLPPETRATALIETKKFKVSVDRWRRYMHRAPNYIGNDARAKGVSIGFKAPVTMLLLPLLKEEFGPIKYIHVVRDGRDVSLSSNQSPVIKFYNSTYADAKERRARYSTGSEPVLAMHLWNDWNTQALKWERAHAKEADFDFIVMRSEDLVDPGKKFQSLVRLADFVESPMTREELCCLSRRDSVDLGQSERWTGEKHKRRSIFDREKHGQQRRDSQLQKYGSLQGKTTGEHRDVLGSGGNERPWGSRAHVDDVREDKSPVGVRTRKDRQKQQDEAREDAPKLSDRYGKWREFLKDKPDLSAKLQEEGAEGLATFGYEPHKPYLADTGPRVHDFVCDESIACSDTVA